MSCSKFPDHCGELEPNTDIAGIGVYISFIASACITLVAVSLKFISHQRMKYPDEMLVHWLDQLDQYDAYIPPTSIRERIALGLSERRMALEVPIEPDRSRIFLYGRIPRPLAKALDNSLQSLIIGLADQQAVVALAMLIAAAIEWESISAYHFNLVASLAWFSCFTHALTLLSLMHWMRRSTFLLCLRLSLFITVFSMYLWAQAVARDYSRLGESAYNAACPAHCCLSDRWSQFSGMFTIISLLRVGSVSFLAFILALRFLIDWYRKNCTETTAERIKKFHGCAKVGVLIALMVAAAAGVTGVAFVRDTNSYNGLKLSQAFQDQDLWGFGQIVPMILLIIPFIGAMAGFVDERKKQRDEQKEQDEQQNNIMDENKRQNVPLVTLPGLNVNLRESGRILVGQSQHLLRAETC